MSISIVIYGNCQAGVFAQALNSVAALGGVSAVTADNPRHIPPADLVFLQTQFDHHRAIIKELEAAKNRTHLLPTLYFPGFSPDAILEIQHDGFPLLSPAGAYNSSIVLNAFLKGWSVDEAIDAFNPATYALLQFGQYWETGQRSTVADLDRCGLDGAALFAGWVRKGKFLHTPHHPQSWIVEDIAEALATKLGFPLRPDRQSFPDPLVIHGEWPVYPGSTNPSGAKENFDFRFGPLQPGTTTRMPIPLDDFVLGSYDMYRQRPPGSIRSDRLTQQAQLYDQLRPAPRRVRAVRQRHLYTDLPDSAFWQKAVAGQTIAAMDPMVSTKFTLRDTDGIATIGSCFAQQIAKALVGAGRNYLVAEPPPPHLSPLQAAQGHYNVFSARYGNVYTSRQFLQLIRRAFGMFTPVDRAWQRPDGRFVDPFRPQIEPEGWESVEDVVAETDRHLGAVRDLLTRMDVLVFTLGLTECWRSLTDGAVFPVPPGVVAGEMDPAQYGFLNLDADAVRQDLHDALDLIKSANPAARIILTVSPVSIVATYEKRHVMVSNSYTKSTLRSAVDDVTRSRDDVDYFPSYDLMAGSYTNGIYLEANRRTITPAGVSHVMRIFNKHYLGVGDSLSPVPAIGGLIAAEISANSAVLCDEELLDEMNGPSASKAPPTEIRQAEIDEWVETLAQMTRYAQRRRLCLVAYVVPSQSSLEPGTPALKGAEPSAYDRLLHTAAIRDLTLTDLRPALRRAQDLAEVYAPGAAQWTDYGAACIWNELVKNLPAATRGAVVDQPCDPSEVATKLEHYPAYLVYGPYGPLKRPGYARLKPDERPVETISYRPLSELDCVFLSDPIGVGLTPHVISTFHRSFHCTQSDDVSVLTKERNPDVVLICIDERRLDIPLGDVEHWQAIDMFERAPDTGPRWTSDAGPAGLRPNAGDRSNAFYVTFDTPRTGDLSAAVRIVFRGSEDTVVGVSFTAASGVWNKRHTVHPGLNEIYFQLPPIVDGEHFWISAKGDDEKFDLVGITARTGTVTNV